MCAVHKTMRTIRVFASISTLTLVTALVAFSQTALTSLDGSRIDVGAQRDKVVVLAVGAAWLPLSSKQAEYVNALAKKYEGKPVAVYFVLTDSANPKSKNFTSPEALREFASKNKVAVPVLLDPDGAATLRRYKIDQVPSFVVLDKGGAAVGEPIGGISAKYDVAVGISKVVDKIL